MPKKIEKFLKRKKNILLVSIGLVNLFLITEIIGKFYSGIHVGTIIAFLCALVVYFRQRYFSAWIKEYGISKFFLLLGAVTAINLTLALTIKPQKTNHLNQ